MRTGLWERVDVKLIFRSVIVASKLGKRKRHVYFVNKICKDDCTYQGNRCLGG